MTKFIICTVIVLALLFAVSSWKTKTSVPVLFNSPAHIAPQLLAANGAECTVSTSTPERGIVGMSYYTDPSKHQREEYDALKDLGVRHVRIDFGWKYIAHTEGAHDWTQTDALVRALTLRGISISDALVTYPPEYLQDWNDAETQMEAFMQKIVERYKPGGEFAGIMPEFPGIRYWEIINEPNLPGLGFVPPSINPSDFVDAYALLLMSANRGVRKADPSAFVIMGGLSPDGMPPEAFLSRVLLLAPNCFDILAFHPYGDPENFLRTATHLKVIMSEHGIKERPIWFNEYGESNDTLHSSVIPQVFTNRNSVDGFFWFTLRDLAPVGENYGVLDYQYTQKPGYQLLKNAFTNAQKTIISTSTQP